VLIAKISDSTPWEIESCSEEIPHKRGRKKWSVAFDVVPRGDKDVARQELIVIQETEWLLDLQNGASAMTRFMMLIGVDPLLHSTLSLLALIRTALTAGHESWR
jgi:hypothetical protein